MSIAAPTQRAGAWSAAMTDFQCVSWCGTEIKYNQEVCDSPQCLGCGCACLRSCGLYTCDIMECLGCRTRGKQSWKCWRAPLSSPAPAPPPRSSPPPLALHAPSPPPTALSELDPTSCYLGGSVYLVDGRQITQADFERSQLDAPLPCAPRCGEHEGMAFAHRHFFLSLALKEWDETAIVRLTLRGAQLSLLSLVGGSLAYDAPGPFDDELAASSYLGAEHVAALADSSGAGIERMHDDRRMHDRTDDLTDDRTLSTHGLAVRRLTENLTDDLTDATGQQRARRRVTHGADHSGRSGREMGWRDGWQNEEAEEGAVETADLDATAVADAEAAVVAVHTARSHVHFPPTVQSATSSHFMALHTVFVCVCVCCRWRCVLIRGETSLLCMPSTAAAH
jgi:hypothetical protein